MFSFSTGPSWYHVFRAGAGRTREKCNRHKISTADHASREFPLSLAIPAPKFSSYVEREATYISFTTRVNTKSICDISLPKCITEILWEQLCQTFTRFQCLSNYHSLWHCLCLKKSNCVIRLKRAYIKSSRGRENLKPISLSWDTKLDSTNLQKLSDQAQHFKFNGMHENSWQWPFSIDISVQVVCIIPPNDKSIFEIFIERQLCPSNCF